MDKVNLTEKFGLFSQHWQPKIAGEVNDCYLKLVKLKGEFVWHQHEHEDELFLVVSGTLRMKLRQGQSKGFSEHLAEPTSLQPVKQVYVVWVQAPGQPPENQGVLKVNENLEGSIKMITKSQSLFVTAEDTPSVTQPSTMEVLRASIQNR